MPLDEKGKLNCRGLFGGREKLSKFQDSYAKALAPLGVERGIKGSRATHTEIKDYYASIMQEPDQALDTQTIHDQLADRKRALKEKQEMERTARGLAQERERLQLQVEKLEGQLRSQVSQTEHWKTQYQSVTDQLRELPLEEVAYELGLNRDSQESKKWRNENCEINIQGSKFYDWQSQQGGGGAIDLVMQVQGSPYKEAVLWLHEHFGEAGVLQAATRQVKAVIREAPPQPFVPPVQDETQWQAVKRYLTRVRKLPEKVVDALHESRLLYADAKQNAVFIRRSLNDPKVNGASLRGTVGDHNSFHGFAAGTRRSAGWFYWEHGEQTGDPIQRAVLCKSPIDVISFAVLDPAASSQTVYLAVEDGSHLPVEFLRSLPKQSVTIAMTKDVAGDVMTENIRLSLPETVRRVSQSQDWNEDLKQALDLLGQALRQQEKSQRRSPKQSER